MLCKKCKANLPDDSKFCLQCGAKQVKANYRRSRANGMGSVYKRGKTWTAVWIAAWEPNEEQTDHGEAKPKTKPVKETKGGFPTKTEALACIPTLKRNYEQRLLRKIATPEGQIIDINEPVTIKSLWRGYEKSSYTKLSKDKKKCYDIAYNRLCKAGIDDIDIRSLTIEILQDAVDKQATTYYPRKDMKTVISILYKRAIAQQTINSNIAPFIELPELIEREGVPFTEEEQRNIWESYSNGNTFAGFILFMIYTGAMPGEVFKVEKSMINWEAQEIVGAGIKTKKRKNTPIIICDLLVPVLDKLVGLSDSDLLWPYSKDTFYERYYATLDVSRCRHLPPYSGRHTTGTALALNEIPDSITQEIMRHGSYKTTRKFYTHIDTTHTRNALNQTFSVENDETSEQQ